MKEISVELCERDVAICVKCGAIFEGAKDTDEDCPECKEEMALRWVIPGGDWIESVGGHK